MTTKSQINSNMYQIVDVDANGNPTSVKPQYIANANITVNPAGSNTQVQYNNNSQFGASAAFTFNNVTNTLSATNFAGSGTQITNILATNITGTIANASYAANAGVSNVAYNVSLANVSGIGNIASINLSGNVSSILLGDGTWGTLPNTANANYANFAGTAFNVSGSNVSGDVSGSNHANVADVANSVSGSNVTGQVANALVAGTVYTNAQPNITSVGTLANLNVGTDATIAGNLTVGGNIQYSNITQLYVTDPIIELGGAPNNQPLTSNDGKDRGTLLHYYTTQPVDAFMGWDSSNSEFAFGSNVINNNDVVTVTTYGNVRADNFIGNLIGKASSANVADSANSVAGANVTGQVANALVAGTVYTNAQPNITSVGTLTGLTVSGNLASGNISTTGVITGNGSVPAGGAADTYLVKDSATDYDYSWTDRVNAKTIYENVKNISGVTLAKGTPVYQIGITGNTITVGIARADDPAKLSIGVLDVELIDQAEGRMIVLGEIKGVNTLGFTTGDEVYLGATGGYTNVKPTASNVAIQFLGVVNRVSDTVGSGFITGTLTPDSTKYQDGYAQIWTGTAWVPATEVSSDTTPTLGGNLSASTYDITGTGNLSMTNIIGNGSQLTNLPAANIVGTVANANHSVYSDTANSVAVGNVSGIGNIATVNLDGNLSNVLYGNGVFAAVASVSLAGDGGNISNINGANVTGQVSYAATANSVAVANVSGIGNIATVNLDGSSSNVLYGNGQWATITIPSGDKISNGTSNVSIPAANGNVNISVNGNANVTQVDGNGTMYINHPQGNFNNSIRINNYGRSGNAGASRISSFKYRGNATTPISVQPNDGLMEMFAIGYNGTALATTSSGRIIAAVDSSYVANATNIPVGWQIVVNDTTGNVNTAKTHNFYSNGSVSFANTIYGNGSGLTALNANEVIGPVALANSAVSVPGANVSGEVSFAATANSVTAANISGTIGFATSSDVANTANSVAVANVVGIGNIATVNLNGNGSQVLAGNGIWVAQSGGGSGTPGGSNTQLQFNDNGAFGGIPTVTYASGNLSLGSVANVKVSGGVNNEVLRTDGAGNLSFSSIALNLLVGTRTGPYNVPITNYTINVQGRSGNITVSVS